MKRKKRNITGKNNPMYGKHHTEETKKKIGDLNRGNISPMKGKTHTKEARIKIGNRKYPTGREHHMYGKTHDDSIKIKIGNRKYPTGKDHHMYGKKHNDSAIKKIVENRKKQVLPLKDTSIEVKVQNLLKQLGIKFVTHKYMKIKYGYQCDIFIPVQKGITQKIVIECDGDYWHGNLEIYSIDKMRQETKEQRCLDYERTAQLGEAGFRVIRLWENEINKMQADKLHGILVE